MAELKDIATRRRLAAMAETNRAPSMFLKKMLFSRKKPELFASSKIDVDTVNKARKLAGYTGRGQEASIVAKDKFDTSEFVPPYVNEKIVFDYEDADKRHAGETPYGEQISPEAAALLQTNEAITTLNDRLSRREEHQCAELLMTGKITGENNRAIDFGMPGSHLITLGAGSRWNEAGADPLVDLGDVAKINSLDSGRPSGLVIAGWEAVDELLSNEKVIKAMDTRKLDRGLIDVSFYKELNAAYIGTVKTQFGTLDIWSYTDTFQDNDGESQFYIPPKQVWVGSPFADYRMWYAAVTAGRHRIRTDRYFDTFVDKDPEVESLRLRSAPLAVGLEMASQSTMTVLQ